jgi:hypothetical protein
LSFSGDLLRSIGIGGFVETGPALLNITRAACSDIYGTPPVKDSLGLGNMCFLHPRGDDRSSAADAFRVEVGVFLRNAFLDHGTDDTPDRTAGNGAGRNSGRGRNEPTGSDHGTHTRNGKHAKTGEETAGTAGQCAKTGTGSCAFCGAIALGFDIHTIRLVGGNADVIGRDARVFQR